ncbi:MAG: hypothetical protein AB1505_31490 [Candidatus Latescibacterota bacterium]
MREIRVGQRSTAAHGASGACRLLAASLVFLAAAVTVELAIPLTTAPEITPAQADFDRSGNVDFGDFFLFADAFGSPLFGEQYDPKFDLD